MNFSKIINGIKEAFISSGYSRTAKELYLLSDRQLVDLGFSRELLKLGVKGYPWRSEQVTQSIPENVTQLHVNKVNENILDMSIAPKAA